MQRFDVVVVGGGPAGAVTARIAAETGAEVLLLEQRTRIEEPSACAGLVSPRTLAVLGASDACVVRRPRDVSFHAPGGAVLSLRTTTDRALVIDRSILELELLARARGAGVDVRLGTTAHAWRDGVVRCDAAAAEGAAVGAILVGADGPESRVAAWAGLPAASNLRALQVEAESPGPEADDVHVFVGRRVAPGFFAWSIPAQAGRRRIGLAVSDEVDPAPYLDRLLAQRFPNHRMVSRIEARIPIPSPRRTTADGALLVGDAAGHVKPLSGGGLYFGGLCARVAGRAAARAAKEPGEQAEHLRRYEDACRELIGPETRFGATARAIRDALDDDDWSTIFGILHHRDVLALVAERIDLDHLRHMVPHLVSRPRLWRPLFAVWDVVRVRTRASGTVAGSHDEFL
jgi:digeranylgeranylglycerophospholipid reductase